jgi:hypothetical protein
LDYFLPSLSNVIDFYHNYDKILVLGDFNCETINKKLSGFLEEHLFFSHLKSKTCYKSNEGKCIDLILSNQKHSLQFTGSVDTGISDFHHLVYTMLKSTFIRLPPKYLSYRCYKKFDGKTFQDDLSNMMNCNLPTDYNSYNSIYKVALDIHAPIKHKYIRGNQKPHANKTLCKAIMKRSKLRNIFLKSKLTKDWDNYKQQRNFVTNLNRETRRIYFKNATSKTVNSNPKIFWKLCNPFLQNKNNNLNRFVLVEHEKIITDEHDVAQIFNSHFADITKDLKIFSWKSDLSNHQDDPVLNAICKYSNHPSILKIKSHTMNLKPGVFEFTNVDISTVYKMIMSLNAKKATSGDIPVNVLKQTANISAPILCNLINQSLQSCEFPSELKQAILTPIFKKGDSTNKVNYRPISILPSVSKVFEKILHSQLSSFSEKSIFSKFLCGFRKGHSTQHALFRLLHSWQANLDKSKIVGIVLMDLSKAFDCLPYDLFIAKLHAYGFSNKSIRLIYNYLTNRIHKVKIGSCFSDWLEFQAGVPQGSILGPLLFNIFINDLFLLNISSEICNFADDNTLSAEGDFLFEVVSKLKTDLSNVLHWFKINSMAPNSEKFQLMFLGNPGTTLNVNGYSLKPSKYVKLLGVEIDNELKFTQHIKSICKKASQKINALARIRNYLDLNCTKTLYNAFLISPFMYCPLIWMFHSKSLNSLINKVHRRALSIVYDRFGISLNELLKLDNSVSIHVLNLRWLMIEVYKSLNKLNPKFMRGYFSYKEIPYDLRGGPRLILPIAKTRSFGFNSLSFRSNILWNILPCSIKQSKSLNEFTRKIKLWGGGSCSCAICI